MSRGSRARGGNDNWHCFRRAKALPYERIDRRVMFFVGQPFRVAVFLLFSMTKPEVLV